MSYVKLLALTCLACNLASSTQAQENLLKQVTLTDVEGRSHSGTLEKLDPESVTLAGKSPQRFQTKDLVGIQRGDGQTHPVATDPLVLLTNGDRLVLRSEALDEEFLTARWVHFPSIIKLPLEAVRGMIGNMPQDTAARTRIINRLLNQTDRQDMILLNNGDTATGQLLSLNEKTYVLKTTAGESTIERAGVRAVGLNPELTSQAALKGAGALLTLDDGSRLHAVNLRLASGDTLALKLPSGLELNLPLSALRSLRFLGGRVTYLSDLEPKSYKFTPYLDLIWPLRRDFSVAGGPLQLRGMSYVKGLGMHSQSEVTYALDGKFRRFKATIGVDNDTAGKGSVLFEVLKDGKSAYVSKLLTGSSPAVVLDPIDIEGARTLTLRVDFGTFGDIQDHADWCDALLVK